MVNSMGLNNGKGTICFKNVIGHFLSIPLLFIPLSTLWPVLYFYTSAISITSFT